MKYDLRWGLTTLGRPEATLAESMQDADRFNIEFIENFFKLSNYTFRRC